MICKSGNLLVYVVRLELPCKVLHPVFAVSESWCLLFSESRHFLCYGMSGQERTVSEPYVGFIYERLNDRVTAPIR